MFDWFESGGLVGATNGVAGRTSPPTWSDWAGFACHDTPDALVYTLSVPGFRKKDIEVEVRDAMVVVRGERRDGVFRPRPMRSFVQSFTLASTLDEQDVRADLRDGVLSVTVAKKPEARARSIPIRVEGQPEQALLPHGKDDEAPEKSNGWWRRLVARFRRG